MAKRFQVRVYKDCEEVTRPQEADTLFLVLEGLVNVIPDEAIFKRVNLFVRRTRKKRQRARE